MQIALLVMAQILAGQNEYWKSGGANARAPFAEEFKAAHLRQHHIENHQLRQSGGYFRAGLRALRSRAGNENAGGEHLFGEFASQPVGFYTCEHPFSFFIW